MSGPKVVDIQALRRQQQRDSAKALKALTVSVDECNGLLQEASPAVAEKFTQCVAQILAELDALRAAEDWENLLNRTTAYREFYANEVKMMRSDAIERRAKALRRSHQTRQRTLQLVTELKALPETAERNARLVQLITAQEDTEMGEDALKAVEAAALYISTTREENVKARFGANLQKLASLYADTDAGMDGQLQVGHIKDADEARLERFWTLLAELEAVAAAGVGSGTSAGSVAVSAQLQEWKEQLIAAQILPRADRPLRLDSLALDLSEHLKAQRARRSAEEAVRQAMAEIEVSAASVAETAVGSRTDHQQWIDRLSHALEGQISAAKQFALAQEARDWLAAQESREDSRTRRIAVLQALNSLGYEVRDSMETAWIENGRLVVHKPDDPVYAVEISAPATGSTMQARVVAAAHQPRTLQRDVEVEVAWCGEFDRLRDLLALQGLATTLKHAQEPGSIPIKIMAVPAAENTQTRHVHTTTPALKERRL